MRESDFKDHIIREIRKEGGYGRRIEDRFSVGQPDMFLIPKLAPAMWVEAKIIAHNLLKPRPRQFIELLRIYRPLQCLTYMIGWKDDVIYIAPPDQSTHIESCIQQKPGESVGDLIRRAVYEEPNDRGT